MRIGQKHSEKSMILLSKTQKGVSFIEEEEKDKEILKIYKSEKRISKISEKLDISWYIIREILKKNKVYEGEKHYLDYYKKEIISLTKQKLTYEEIQNIMRKNHPSRNKRAINFNKFTISQKIKEWGIKRKKVLRHKTIVDPNFLFDLYNPKELMATEFGQVLIGTLLGDASIHKKYYFFAMSHCELQKKYLEEKVKILSLDMKIKLKAKAKKVYIIDNFYNITNQYSTYTKMYPFLEKIYKDFYPDGKKIIKFDYVDNLNVLGLFIWLYDDGSFRVRKKNGSEICLHIPCFEKNQLQKLINSLITNFNLDKITLTKRNRLYFNKKSQIRLCELFIQNIPLSLLKSINQKYVAILDILKSSELAKDLKNNLGKGVRLG